MVSKGDNILEIVAADLGVLADHRIKVLVGVEGPNDCVFFRHICVMLHGRDNEVPLLHQDPRIAFFELGGRNLAFWVQTNCLRELNRPEVHLYDRGTAIPPQYQPQVELLAARQNQSFAVLTTKRELENYLHPDAIRDSLGVDVQFGDQDNVPELVAERIHNGAADHGVIWNQLSEDTRKEKIRHVKKRLNDAAASRMTYPMLQQSDPQAEIEGWLRRIAALCNQ